MRLQLSIFCFLLILLCKAGYATTLRWDYHQIWWEDGDEFVPYTNISFNVYYSTNAQDWTLLGNTTNLGWKITAQGWYGVEATDGSTNTLLSDAMLLWRRNIIHVKRLNIGR